MSWKKPCPICGNKDATSHYTQYNFCPDCYEKLKKVFRAIILWEFVSGLEALAKISEREEEVGED